MDSLVLDDRILLPTSAAALPSFTSCSGVYLFFGSLMTVCAQTPATDRHHYSQEPRYGPLRS